MNEAKKSKILTAARAVFLRYGYKRVTMNDLAGAAGVSRPALYVLFKNKEQIFVGAYLQWIDETIVELEAAMALVAKPEDKIERAFEIWALRPFEMAMASPEAQELTECSFGFALAAQQEGYARFESTIAPVLASLVSMRSDRKHMTCERIAHVLASAVRGFKLTAADADGLRLLIGDLLILLLDDGFRSSSDGG